MPEVSIHHALDRCRWSDLVQVMNVQQVHHRALSYGPTPDVCCYLMHEAYACFLGLHCVQDVTGHIGKNPKLAQTVGIVHALASYRIALAARP